ncbi:hypothetical protein DSM43518_04841 [Mycobacterium marinum]|uniref:Uncharacterized protein n=1 Tax=Mycobacterium marinum TaxID=1781 RepID=A0A2Z5YJ57_MYCMR|nr:hypothetical protein [Mycobacterium marinum]AXN51299.1 hypothetical protein CCUG20998_03903 [Mycobacterium marinum]RFZ02854.1 hypothetical protein DSM43518_04841 [Mycobacterium marinum]RFZ26045.1 hypothetical protein DSM43519_01359 [Mycobacterium marinum]RFZ28924.1 hypothetical protein DSM44344_01191 [Mycobacterium marinum]RFZ39110.1 hypothetical protein NCTC2275_00378 [Mycobacterium marinum]
MSDIDGNVVEFTEEPEWRGKVLGDAEAPRGWVRVQWSRPVCFIGIHRPGDLSVVTP